MKDQCPKCNEKISNLIEEINGGVSSRPVMICKDGSLYADADYSVTQKPEKVYRCPVCKEVVLTDEVAAVTAAHAQTSMNDIRNLVEWAKKEADEKVDWARNELKKEWEGDN